MEYALVFYYAGVLQATVRGRKERKRFLALKVAAVRCQVGAYTRPLFS